METDCRPRGQAPTHRPIPACHGAGHRKENQATGAHPGGAHHAGQGRGLIGFSAFPFLNQAFNRNGNSAISGKPVFFGVLIDFVQQDAINAVKAPSNLNIFLIRPTGSCHSFHAIWPLVFWKYKTMPPNKLYHFQANLKTVFN